MARNLRYFRVINDCSTKVFPGVGVENGKLASVFHNPLTFSVNWVDGNYTLLYSRLSVPSGTRGKRSYGEWKNKIETL